jgi:lysophospholipase L1-like esterase
MAHARMDFRRRTVILSGTAFAALGWPPGPLHAATSETWRATWGAAPAGPPPAATTLVVGNQTLRLIVRTSMGGSRVRVRISNEMGAALLRIGAAGIGLRASGAAIVAGSGRVLTFGGQPGIAIPAGAAVQSDPVDLPVAAGVDLAVSLYLPDATRLTTLHDLALQTNYLSSAGNHAGAQGLPVARTLGSWPFLTEVAVASSGLVSAAGAFVAFGDSLTDGARSTANANRRWPDAFARRLARERPSGSPPVGVVNRGISANSLLKEYANAMLAGQSGLRRFDRDVLGTTGARWVLLLIGTNDILYSSASSPVPAESLIAGYVELAVRARARGLGVLAGTMPPFEGHVYYTAARDATRRRANDWIRAGGAFDAVADFDAALRDPGRPARLLPAYDSGDHLHPNDAGYARMAAAVPLAPFG